MSHLDGKHHSLLLYKGKEKALRVRSFSFPNLRITSPHSFPAILNPSIVDNGSEDAEKSY